MSRHSLACTPIPMTSPIGSSTRRARRCTSPPPRFCTRCKHWILYTGRRGYGAYFFHTMGRTLPAFLANLDMMHARLSLKHA